VTRRGFTFVELLVAMTIVALLSAVAVPKYHDMKRRAFATQIVGDFDVVKVACFNYYADKGRFPDDAGTGVVPDGLEPYLPIGFSFDRPDWDLDYERTATFPSRFVYGDEIVGISVITTDPKLGQAAMRMVSGATAVMGGKYAFILSGI